MFYVHFFVFCRNFRKQNPLFIDFFTVRIFFKCFKVDIYPFSLLPFNCMKTLSTLVLLCTYKIKQINNNTYELPKYFEKISKLKLQIAIWEFDYSAHSITNFDSFHIAQCIPLINTFYISPYFIKIGWNIGVRSKFAGLNL